MGVLLGLAIIETIVLHGIAMALWGWRVAIVRGVIDVSLVVALVGLLRAIRRYPVSIEGDVLTMRLGRRKGDPDPGGKHRRAARRWEAAALKQKGVRNLALANWPNVMLDLDPPVLVRGKAVTAVAHKLDEPQDFITALHGRISAR